MIHFVGAGPGAPDLITLRGARLLCEADVVIWAGSLVNPALLDNCKAECEIFDSSRMTLDEVLAVMERAESEGKTTVRLHTGDPSLYGALREQLDALRERGVAFDVTPGVSSLFGAAAALGAEFTLPGVSQSLIVTRLAGPLGLDAGCGSDGAARGRLCARHARGAGLQGDLAGRAGRPLHGRHARRGGRGGGDRKDRADPRRLFSGRAL